MTQPSLLTAALYYAEKLHLHIFPCHEAIFNNEGECVGCTCEAWKRTQAKYGPDYKCPKPGKCPRVKWKEKATNDPQAIRRWWHRWPTANIAWVPGRDGYITLDLDNYKKHFAGAAALSPDEQRTITNQSQAGGQHLIYRKPEGATYSNSPGELPKGLDVRADNGYILLPPSLGESGNRYQRKPGMWFGEIEAQLLPTRIHTMLLAAKTSAPAASVHLGEPSSVPPDLAAWALSERILEAIHTPAAKGGRSEQDMTVCVALCYAGAADTDILSIFHHYPCGNQGKYAERGADYLARTIGAARRYVADCPRQQFGPPLEDESAPGIPLSALVDSALAWVKTAECAELLRSGAIPRVGTGRKILAALYQMGRQRGPRFVPGVRDVAKVAACSIGTVSAYLPRLAALDLFGLCPTDAGLRIELKFDVARLNTYSPIGSTRTDPTVDRCSIYARQKSSFYGDHLNDDAFQSARYVRAIQRRGLPTVLANSYSAEDALVWDALEEDGELTRKEMEAKTGVSAHTAASATRKFVRDGFVLEWQEHPRAPKSYLLHPDAERRLDLRRPEMKSAGVGFRRDLRHAEAQFDYARKGDNPQRELRLAEKFDTALAQVYPEWSTEERQRYIYAPKPPKPDRARPQRLATLVHGGERAERKAEERHEAATYASAGNRWRRQEYAKSKTDAEINWSDFSAWAMAEHGPGWWLDHDMTGVLGQYRLYQLSADNIPTMHWEGAT